jgi:tRNA (cmo5U34)-methyltransferase
VVNPCAKKSGIRLEYILLNSLDLRAMSKDQVFEKIQNISDFKFGSDVASVFDDMVNRSVPFYGEIQRMTSELAADYARSGTDVYDLGCATGATLIGMNTSVAEDIRFIGIDDSQEMLAQCQKKLDEAGVKRPVELRVADLNKTIDISNASVVISCLTLQFVRPIYRGQLLQSVFDGLHSGGALILVEKVLAEDGVFNREFIKHYYNYKRRNHYTEMEISQKREALENILIPYRHSENITLLLDTGFAHCEVFFKWYNFVGLIAIKE